MAVQGTDLPIWGMEIDPESAQVCPPLSTCGNTTRLRWVYQI